MWLWIPFLLLSSFLGRIHCLAAPSSKLFVVVSTQKNGGHTQIFDGSKKNHDDDRDDDDHHHQVNHFGTKTTTTLTSSNTRRQQQQQRTAAIITILKNLQSKILSNIRSTFLPIGFPKSVPPGYLSFSIWSWIQDWSTSLRAVLATQNVLAAMGVGDATATALSAAQNYLVRDFAGMMTVLGFTSLFAHSFGPETKRWRIFADVILDVGITMEVLAVHLPKSWFLIILCLANACKAMCGVAAGSVSGNINLFWCRNGADFADIKSKFGAQHTCTAALALIIAGYFAKAISHADNIRLVWSIYGMLTILHIYANVRCMRILKFDSLNTIRLEMVMNDFLKQLQTQEQYEPDEPTQQPRVASPEHIASREPLFFLPTIENNIQIRFGVSFNFFANVSGRTSEELQDMLDQAVVGINASPNSDNSSQTVPYLIAIGKGRRHRTCIVVSFLENSLPIHQLQAYVHAVILRRNIHDISAARKGTSQPWTDDDSQMAEESAKQQLPLIWNTFCKQAIHAGWDIEKKCELRSSGYEVALVR